MPFTSFHFGPSACVALPLNRRIDLPVFLLANVAIDIEPLLVMVFHLSSPLHGYAHTLAGATVVGALCGAGAYWYRNLISDFMTKVFLQPYAPTLNRMLLSGILGTWFHVALDSLLYDDIRPFWPLQANPLLGLVGQDSLYSICAWAFLPAAVLFGVIVFLQKK